MVSGSLVGVLLLAIAVTCEDQVAEKLSPPTCAHPEGLEALAVRRATGASEVGHEAEDAVDGYLGSIWVPPLLVTSESGDPDLKHLPLFVGSEDERTLALTLRSPGPVDLVCVNNAMASSRFTFEQWGKVQKVVVWTDRDWEKRPATLVSMPESDWQVGQKIAGDLDDVSVVYIRVDGALAGATAETFDPNHCSPEGGDPRVPVEEITVSPRETAQLRYERGCILAPSPQAGLSEVVLYRDQS